MTESHAVMFEIETAQITPTENLMLEALERYAAKVQYVPADRRGGVW